EGRDIDAELRAVFHAGTSVDVIETEECRGGLHDALAIGFAVVDEPGRRFARVSRYRLDRIQLGIFRACRFLHFGQALIQLARSLVSKQLLDGFSPDPGASREAQDAGE